MYSSPRTKKKRVVASNTGLQPVPDHEISVLNSQSKDFFPFITYTEEAFCIFCKRPSAPLIKIPSGIFINLNGYVHEICLKNRGCCECGVLGLCFQCSAKDCPRLIHSWCAEALHKNSNICDLHSNSTKKKESSRLPLIKSICRRVVLSSFWEKDYKDKDSPASICNGHIFWYILGLEYFPIGFDLTCFPAFPILKYHFNQYEYYGDSGNYVEKSIEKISGDLEDLKTQNKKIIDELIEEINVKKLKLVGNDLIGDCENFDTVNNEYLNLLENKPQPVEEGRNSLAGLRKPERVEKEALCAVCAEENFEEGLVSCEICKISVHPKCYQILVPLAWTCEICKTFGFPKQIPCALCPKKGGALKKTIHLVSDSSFPNYSSLKPKEKKEVKQHVWVHVFCAINTSKVVFKNNGIDLSSIEPSRFGIECEICKSKEGACVQCNFNRCCSAFHPECGKDLFVSTKTNEKKIYCALHKPLKLRKVLETRHKKISEDIYKFCKAIEKYLNKPKVSLKVQKRKRNLKLRNNTGKIFTPDEDLALEYRIQQFLYKTNLSQKKPFTININLKASTRCSRVNITRPQFYTLIVPSVILEEGITIENRNAEECFKRFSDTLFSKLKNEMLLLGNRLCLYQGRDTSPSKHYSRPKKKSVEYALKVSEDKYCICNQPYYYEIPWISEWTQEQWEQKVRDNQMIECTKCEKWFHLKCVGYEGNLDKAQQDDTWKCFNCDKKKTEKVKYLDQKFIISDINQGVVTRRGTKIQ